MNSSLQEIRWPVCSKRKGLLYILNTSLKNTVFMSGAPCSAAMSAASGSFQGRGATFFLSCSVAQWHKIRGKNIWFSKLSYEHERE